MRYGLRPEGVLDSAYDERYGVSRDVVEAECGKGCVSSVIHHPSSYAFGVGAGDETRRDATKRNETK